jgi:hypothetical protein
MPNHWVSQIHDQLILVNKGVNKKEQLEKGDGAGLPDGMFSNQKSKFG